MEVEEAGERLKRKREREGERESFDLFLHFLLLCVSVFGLLLPGCF